MASVVLGAPSITYKLINFSSRISFSRSETLTNSLSAPDLSLSISDCFFSISTFRGDKKTAKGKRFNHSFGNARTRNKKKGRGPPRVQAPPSPPKKDRFDNEEIVKIEIDESLF